MKSDFSIRQAEYRDLPEVECIFQCARNYMIANGNKNQWINGYPERKKLLDDINKNQMYVIVDSDDKIEGTFCFFTTPDPNYEVIKDGAWLNDEPYGVIHRLASAGRVKGIAEVCFKWCMTKCPNLRVDTHRDNKTLQHILAKYNFSYCGIINVENGTERLAFQKVI